MYKVKKTWLTGWVMLPFFTVKVLKGAEGAEMTCGNFLGWIFQYLLSPFWSGKIHITGEYDE